MRTEFVRRDVRALLGLPARCKAKIVENKHLGVGLDRWLLQICGTPSRRYCGEDTSDSSCAHRQEALQHRRYGRNIRIDACEGELREYGQDDVPEHLVSPTYPLFFEGVLVIRSQVRGLGLGSTSLSGFVIHSCLYFPIILSMSRNMVDGAKCSSMM